MRTVILVAALLVGLGSVATARPSARSPRPGRLTHVDCLVAADQSYALYLPKRYAPNRPWPILYCFDPGGDGEGMVKRFQGAAEKLGWIVAGSLTARNGPEDPNNRAWREMLRDTETRFRLHGKQRVACGFSGMSWVASRMAYARPERFAGVILLGQGMDPNITVDPNLAVAMIMGDRERRLHELEDIREMCHRGTSPIPNFCETFPGGHTVAPEEWLARALRWQRDTWNTRYDGCHDAETRRRDRAMKKRFAAAVALQDAGKAAHALVEYRQVRDGFRNMPTALVRDLDAHIAALEASPDVGRETEAHTTLRKLVARDRKLRPKQRRALVKKYEKLAVTFPGTPSAEVALERAAMIKTPAAP